MHENTFSAPFKVFYVKQPPNGVLPFANCHFQIGIIIMGITEHFGNCMTVEEGLVYKSQGIVKVLIKEIRGTLR